MSSGGGMYNRRFLEELRERLRDERSAVYDRYVYPDGEMPEWASELYGHINQAVVRINEKLDD